MSYRDPRYTAAIKLLYNAVLYVEHPTPLRWDSGAAKFEKKELKAIYRYLGDCDEFPENLSHDLPTLALLNCFIATALIDDLTEGKWP